VNANVQQAVVAVERNQASANPARALDGLLVRLLGSLRRSGGSNYTRARSPMGFTYPEEDIAALNAAKRFLVSAGVVNK
jgi:hypothetical protein